MSTSIVLLLVGVDCGAGGAGGPAATTGARVHPHSGLRLGGLDDALTPTLATPHRLSVTVLTFDVPAVHLLVTDPGKADGTRAPGY